MREALEIIAFLAAFAAVVCVMRLASPKARPERLDEND